MANSLPIPFEAPVIIAVFIILKFILKKL
jgi:hypothetical protein